MSVESHHGTRWGMLGALAVPAVFLAAPALAIVAVLGTLFVVIGTGGAAAACTTSTSSSTSTVSELEVTTSNGSSTTLGENQLRNAALIVAVGRELNVSEKGLQIAMMTALQESGLSMYANSSVPESLDYPHDAVGSDHDSVNFFQQRVSGWGTVAELMDATYAAKAFFGGPSGPNGGSPRGLLDIPDWEHKGLGEAAQAVQISAHPDAYDKWTAAALTVLNAVGSSVSCTGTISGTAAYPLTPGYQMTSGYGPRQIDVPDAPTWHAALDLQNWPNNCGDPVYAALPGRVVLNSELWLSIQHPDGFIVSYLHMYKSDRLVQLGDEVTAGQQLGLTGNVPPSGGCHLDIRINKNGTLNPAVAQLQEATAVGAPGMYAGYVNPEEFFRIYGLEICPPDSCRRL